MAWVILVVLVLVLVWVVGSAAGAGLLAAGCLGCVDAGISREQWVTGSERRLGFQPANSWAGTTHSRANHTTTRPPADFQQITPRTDLLPGDRYPVTMTREKTGKRSEIESQLGVVAAGRKPPVPGNTRFSTVVGVQEIERVVK